MNKFTRFLMVTMLGISVLSGTVMPVGLATVYAVEAELPAAPSVPVVELPEAPVVPKVEVPEVEVPKVEVPEVEVPKVELPEAPAVPKVEVPDAPAVPTVELPTVPKITDMVTTHSTPVMDKCPYSAKAGRTIVDFSGKRLLSDRGDSQAYTNKVSTNLEAGKYKVSMASWDGYIGRENVSQPIEQWLGVVYAGNSVIAQTNTISDVADKVREASVKEVVNDALVLNQDATSVQAKHAYIGKGKTPNSVNPICAAFDKIEEEPKECELELTKSVDKTSANPGDELNYTVKIKNVGTADCTGGGVRIYDIHNDKLTFVSQTHTSNLSAGYGKSPVYDASTRTLRWNGHDLNPGEEGTIHFTAKINHPTECGNYEIPNQAKATAKELNNFKTYAFSNTVKTDVHNACVVTPVCELDVDVTTVPVGGGDVTFTWTTENADDVSMNRGVGPLPLNGSTTVNVTDSATYVLTVKGPGGTVQCSKPVTVKTDEKPEPPHCPYTEQAGRVIVNFDQRLRSDQGVAQAQTAIQPADLKAGEYKVSLASWDGYIGRENVTQPNEQWEIEFLNSGTSVKTSNSVSDLADKVRSAFVNEVVNSSLELGTVNEVRAIHSYYPDNTTTANSVNPICAAFDYIEEEEKTPECTLTANITEVANAGDSAILTWTSLNADTTVLQGFGDVTSNGTTSVTVNTSTTYIFTVTGDGKTVDCPVTITVPDTPDPLTCENVNFNVSDSKVKRGETVTLSWDWDSSVLEASIDQGIGSVSNSGTEDVRIDDDTTFNITIKNADSERSCPVSVDVDSGGGGSSSPRCDLEISKEKITLGEEVTLTWDTSRVTEVVIKDNHGKTLIDTEDYLAKDKEDYFDGSLTLKPTKDTTYTLNASRGSRDRVCKVSVELDGGVTVTSTRTQDPIVAGISLTQVPYTGFEAGPMLTFIFYTLLTIWALFVAYLFVIRRDSFAGVSFSAQEVKPLVEASVDATTEVEAPALEYVQSVTAPAPANLPTAPVATETPVIGYTAYRAPATEVEVEMNELENRAHSQNTLLSSDAMRYLMNTEVDAKSRIEKLDSVIRTAKVSFPTEDGWVVINLARMETLIGDTKAESVVAEEVAEEVVTTNSGSVAEAIVSGNVVAAYQMIESRPMVALADAASDLDALYRLRKGEAVNVSNFLQSAQVTDEQLVTMITALTSALDGTYPNETDAVKMAVIKAIKVVA